MAKKPGPKGAASHQRVSNMSVAMATTGVLLLSGCSTISSLEETPPAFQAHVDKSPRAVKDCLLGDNLAQAVSEYGDGGYRVVPNATVQNGIRNMAIIVPEGTGSKLTAWTTKGAPQWFARKAAACAS